MKQFQQTFRHVMTMLRRYGRGYGIYIFLLVLLAGVSATGEVREVIYQHGQWGYESTQDTWITNTSVDHNAGDTDRLVVGVRPESDGPEQRGLIRFTDLGLPEGSRILSAELWLYRFDSDPLGGPRVRAYGLLRAFEEEEATWLISQEDMAWGAPGASLPAEHFVYDTSADIHEQPDSVRVVPQNGWYSWDVTESFRSQFEAGQEFGWLLVMEPPGTKKHILLASKSREISDVPLAPYPRLRVRYEPPAGAMCPPRPYAPKLLCFNIGQPAVGLAHREWMDQLPYSGAVFDAAPNVEQPGGRGGLHISVFGPDPIEVEDYTQFIDDAQALFSRHDFLTDNFVRVNAVPGSLTRKDQPYNWNNRPLPGEEITMWWSDFDVVVDNFAVAAEVARRSGCKGILFDWETYAGDIFNYELLADARRLGKTEAETVEQVRRCGRRISRVVSERYPGLTWLILISMYDEQWTNLEAAFMDGLVEGSDPEALFVDGHELAYYIDPSAQEFYRMYEMTHVLSRQISELPDRLLRQKMQVSFGLFITRFGWGDDIELRYSPARWQTRLENALLITDQYVWVYSGPGPNWGTGENIPQSYVDASFRAVNLARLQRGFEILPNTPAYLRPTGSEPSSR